MTQMENDKLKPVKKQKNDPNSNSDPEEKENESKD